MPKEIVKIKNRTEAQAFSEFLYKEGFRHGHDIWQIIEDLHELEKKWGVKPKGIYKGKWIVP